MDKQSDRKHTPPTSTSASRIEVNPVTTSGNAAENDFLKSVLENQADLIARFTTSGEITYVNQAFCDTAGITRQKLIGRNIATVFSFKQVRNLHKALAEMLKSPQRMILDAEHILHDGNSVWVQWIGFPINNSSGQVIDIQIVGRDITSLKHSEETVREQSEFASNLVNIAKKLNSCLDVELILDQIIEALEKIVPNSTSNIMLVDGNNGHVVRSQGYDQMGTSEILHSRVFDLKKVKTFNRGLQTKRELVIPDTQKYPEWTSMPESYWVRSFISAPIVIKDRVYGFIDCDSGIPGTFNEEHAKRLKLLADHAAIAIDNAVEYSTTKKHLEQIALINELTQNMLESKQLSEILLTLPERILSVFEANSIMITKWNCEKKEVTQLAAIGAGLMPNYPKAINPGDFSITEELLDQKNAVVITAKDDHSFWRDHLSHYFSDRVILALPMVSNENPIGAILIGFKTSKQLTQAEISIGEYAALQIATIIAKSAMYENAKIQTAQFQHANDLIASLSYVATSILSTKGIGDIIQTMGSGLEKMDIHSVMFFKDQKPNHLSLEYCSRNDQLLAQFRSLGSPIEKKITLTNPNTVEFQVALEQQRIVFVDNPGQLLKYILPVKFGPFVAKFQEALDIQPATKSLFLPLIVDQKTIGLLGLYGKNLQEIDLKAGEIFNSQISVALENARLLAEVQRLAVTDELTGLNNRRGLFELGNRELTISMRLNRVLTSLMIDLDNFKAINDKYGHAIGDKVLQKVAQIIASNIREIDILGRYGGEEFVVLLIENGLPDALAVAERIRQAIADTGIITEVGEIHVTVSIGVDELNALIMNLDMLINRTDRALYIAKRNGRNQVATLKTVENSNSKQVSH